MRIFFINTDARYSQGVSRHDDWLKKRVVVASGEAKYREALARVGAGDLVLVYANGTGIVAIGEVLDDEILNVEPPHTVNPDEPAEYHKRVKWRADLRRSPMNHSELKQLLGQGPLQAVQEIRKKEGREALLRRLAQLEGAPTTDPQTYRRVAAELRNHGLIARPIGSPIPQRTLQASEVVLRDPRVRAWTLQRANGVCELCSCPGPFEDEYGQPFLESHHVAALAAGGPDTPENTAAVCPNCHRELHFGKERAALSLRLKAAVAEKEADEGSLAGASSAALRNPMEQ